MKFALFGAAALTAAAFVTPALAQAVIEDPGYCAQFYPNAANCQYSGPVIPYAGGGFRRNMNAVMLDHASEPSRLEAYRYHGGPKSDY
jgi:hypothetical protein